MPRSGPGSGDQSVKRCAAIRGLDARAPIRIETVRRRIDESLVQERLLAAIAAFLGAVSLLLACGALGGLMSHMVASRTSEIGLRIALGAEPRAVTALVMREAFALVLVGAAWALASRWPAAGSWRASSMICTPPIRSRSAVRPRSCCSPRR